MTAPLHSFHSDVLLRLLASQAPNTGLSITLTVGGSPITGFLVPADVWLDNLAADLQATIGDAAPGEETAVWVGVISAAKTDRILQRTGDETTDVSAASLIKGTDFIHLTDARFIGSDGRATTPPQLWRGLISEVQGWAMGAIR